MCSIHNTRTHTRSHTNAHTRRTLTHAPHTHTHTHTHTETHMPTHTHTHTLSLSLSLSLSLHASHTYTYTHTPHTNALTAASSELEIVKRCTSFFHTGFRLFDTTAVLLFIEPISSFTYGSLSPMRSFLAKLWAHFTVTNRSSRCVVSAGVFGKRKMRGREVGRKGGRKRRRSGGGAVERGRRREG